MSFERMPGPMVAEPAPPAAGATAEPAPDAPTPAALRLQVLATEHWSLLATRSLAWNESFTRAGMFLSALSGAIVALALVAQATAFGDEFALFALVILPVVLFLGLTAWWRIGRSNSYDAQCVVGMNRIRNAYLDIAPEVEPYFVMGTYDDEASVALTMGRTRPTNFLVDVLISTPFVLSVINAVLAGAIGAIVAQQLGLSLGLAVVVAGIAALAIMVFQVAAAMRDINAAVALYRPKFPRPGATD